MSFFQGSDSIREEFKVFLSIYRQRMDISDLTFTIFTELSYKRVDSNTNGSSDRLHFALDKFTIDSENSCYQNVNP